MTSARLGRVFSADDVTHAGMTYIDSAVLNLTEQCCRAFQRLTGRTNVWLALHLTNLTIVVYFLWAVVYSWRGGVAARVSAGLFCGGLLYVLTQTIFRVPIEAYENAAYQRLARGYRNPRRVRDAMLRVSFLTLSIVLCYPIVFVYINQRTHLVLVTYSLIVLTTVVLYLLACDPLPPGATHLVRNHEASRSRSVPHVHSPPTMASR